MLLTSGLNYNNLVNKHSTFCDQRIFCILRQQVGFSVVRLKAIKDNLREIWAEVINCHDCFCSLVCKVRLNGVCLRFNVSACAVWHSIKSYLYLSSRTYTRQGRTFAG